MSETSRQVASKKGSLPKERKKKEKKKKKHRVGRDLV